MPEPSTIRYDVDEDQVALVTIDRPKQRNALSRDAWVEFKEILRSLRATSTVRGLIVTGAGDRAFASGADIAELVDRPPSVALEGLVQGILDELEGVPFPTVAAINGHALGGGWELALACDLRVAVSSARLGFPEVGLGILPGAGGTLRLVRHVGIGLAKEWILTGRLIDADEAHTHGLVNRVVGPNEALVAARLLMDELIAQPATSIRLAKLLLNAAARGDANPELERLAYTLTFHEPDRAERMERFLQRSQRADE
jgi:enoyl-CoA hydratase